MHFVVSTVDNLPRVKIGSTHDISTQLSDRKRDPNPCIAIAMAGYETPKITINDDGN